MYGVITGGEREGVMAFRIVSSVRSPRPINPTVESRLPDKIWDAILGNTPHFCR